MTIHWTAAWEEHILPLVNCPKILLACDFDGTVSPIADTPETAALPASTRALLQDLAGCAGIHLALVSGRELSDLKAKVGLPGVTYCGNHGMQIETPKVYWECNHALSFRPTLVAAIQDLRAASAELAGVLIEDKVFTISIHWRLASEQDRERLREVVIGVEKAYPTLRLTYGKAVWELRPPVRTNKGTAINYLLAQDALQPANALFLGDDHTDESAFEVLQEGGGSTRVGQETSTLARFRADNVPDAANFLLSFYRARRGESFSIYSPGTAPGAELPVP